jgi:hypothetical protein
MSASNLFTQTLESHLQLAEKYFHIVDDLMDHQAFAQLFTSDATFIIGNFPTSVGHEAIANACSGMFAMASVIKHRTTATYSISPSKIRPVSHFK